ncbi:MAG TPA: DUF3558 family protein [Pyrinomonadaceae bacterium]|nr:DUF3558 family protein [Pyrinomonadaceae bacterium]
MFSIAFSLWVVTVALGGCQSPDPHAASPPSSPLPSPGSSTPNANSSTPVALKSRIDPCALLTSDELKAVQGEALQTTLPSERDYVEYFIAQCYYQLPAITNSVVLNVTTSKERGKSVKEFWRTTHAVPRGRKESQEKESPPEQVSGVGEDAYWEASGIAGALYVLKKDVILRISVGGAGDSRSKLEKSKTLAQKALARL